MHYSEHIKNSIKGILRIGIKNPKYVSFVSQTIKNQTKAARIRNSWEKKGIQVPPLVLISITNQCNLKCEGCYATAQKRLIDNEIFKKNEVLENTIREAKNLGVSIIILVGGEPYLQSDLMGITKKFPEILFPIVTNGLLIKNSVIQQLKDQKNVVPFISIEGDKVETDKRRGKGVYNHLMKLMTVLENENIIFGTSLMITRKNYSKILQEELIEKISNIGCKLFFFMEYVPIEEGTEIKVLTKKQKDALPKILSRFSEKFPAMFSAYPTNDLTINGCPAAGKGFVHISSDGWVEPCPFTPYSDVNLRDYTLGEALKSEFLYQIRTCEEKLIPGTGGCCLWENREWLEALLASNSTQSVAILNKGEFLKIKD